MPVTIFIFLNFHISCLTVGFPVCGNLFVYVQKLVEGTDGNIEYKCAMEV